MKGSIVETRTQLRDEITVNAVVGQGAGSGFRSRMRFVCNGDEAEELGNRSRLVSYLGVWHLGSGRH